MALPLTSHPLRHELSVSGAIGSLQLQFDARFSAPWTVLFGPSGCGKSTILRSMCGLAELPHIRFLRTTPEGKSVILQDEDSSIPTAGRALGYAPQSGGLFPHMTAEKNIGFGARVRSGALGYGTLVDEAIELLHLGELRQRFPHELSGGERQRVNLARALAVPDTCLLLLDEPFSGIDRAQRDQLLPGIQEWSQRHLVPVISVTHDVDEVFLLGAEVIQLQAGAVVAQGRPEDVLAAEAERVQRAFLTRN